MQSQHSLVAEWAAPTTCASEPGVHILMMASFSYLVRFRHHKHSVKRELMEWRNTRKSGLDPIADTDKPGPVQCNVLNKNKVNSH